MRADFGVKAARSKPFRICSFHVEVSPRALHAFVVGAAATFGDDPIDDLVGVGNVAGFAMDAVGKVDAQLLPFAVFGHFVHGGWAEILARVAVLDHALGGANI